jgi:aspartate carbamoyltransferase catalytic subunit
LLDFTRNKYMEYEPKSDFVWTRKHLIGIKDLSRGEIEHIFRTADAFRPVGGSKVMKFPALQGKLVVNMFFEDSTRTRNSFALAAKRLSADTLEFTKKASAVSKGETLVDTARNIVSMGVDMIVIRHNAGGAPLLLSRAVNVPIINAGDGFNEHPTQALLDTYTIRNHRGSLDGLKIAIVGDIAHSRVARSDIYAMTKLGAEVTLVGPPTLMPPKVSQLPVKVSTCLDEVIEKVDVINMLRIQFERMGSNPFPSVREYSRFFALTVERLKRAKPDILVMHPGPLNRGVEIESEVADSPNSVILEQVAHGITTRMAVMLLVSQAAAMQRN